AGVGLVAARHAVHDEAEAHVAAAPLRRTALDVADLVDGAVVFDDVAFLDIAGFHGVGIRDWGLGIGDSQVHGDTECDRKAVAVSNHQPPTINRLLRWQPHRAIQPDRLAVEIAAANDPRHQVGEFLRPAEARREGDGSGERLLHLFGHAVHHRGPEDAGGDGVDADAEARQFARHGQGHADHAGLGGRIGGLADLALVGGHAGGVDDRAALAVLAGRVVLHYRGGGPPARPTTGPAPGIPAQPPARSRPPTASAAACTPAATPSTLVPATRR